MAKEVLTTGDISRMLGFAPRTVTKWIDAGDLKAWRLPGTRHRRVMLADLLEFVKRHQMPINLSKIEKAKC